MHQSVVFTALHRQGSSRIFTFELSEHWPFHRLAGESWWSNLWCFPSPWQLNNIPRVLIWIKNIITFPRLCGESWKVKTWLIACLSTAYPRGLGAVGATDLCINSCNNIAKILGKKTIEITIITCLWSSYACHRWNRNCLILFRFRDIYILSNNILTAPDCNKLS